MISHNSITSFKTLQLKHSCSEVLGSGLQHGMERGQNSAHSSCHALRVWDEETIVNKEGKLPPGIGVQLGDLSVSGLP